MPIDTIVAEIEKKERLLSKRKQLFFADEDHSIPTESQVHPVSYFACSPDIADNEDEFIDSHPFDEQVHAMNENTGGSHQCGTWMTIVGRQAAQQQIVN